MTDRPSPPISGFVRRVDAKPRSGGGGGGSRGGGLRVDAICTVHNQKRPTHYLVEQPDGTWQCSARDPCRVAELKPLCDLCGNDVGKLTVEQHHRQYHGELLDRVVIDLNSVARLPDITMPNLEQLGRLVTESARAADGGPERWEYVMRCVKQLNAMLRSTSSRAGDEYHGCMVYLFGSCIAQGCWDGFGDIDCTLLNAHGWETGHWPPKDEGKVVLRNARALRTGGFFFDDLEPLTHTRVPIVKHHASKKHLRHYLGDPFCETLRFTFSSQSTGSALQSKDVDELVAQLMQDYPAIVGCKKTHVPNQRLMRFESGADAVAALVADDTFLCAKIKTNIKKEWATPRHRPEIFHTDFDLSCRGHGVRNSFLLRAYMSQSHEVRMGSVFLKKWSKRAAVNYSMKGYLTSYAVNILWLHFLLARELVDFVDPASIPKVPVANFGTDYIPMMPECFQPSRDGDAAAQQQRLDDERRMGYLLTDFFRYYATEFDWETNVVSVTKTRPLPKAELGWTSANEKTDTNSFRDRVWYRFCIEDPYEANLSLGRHLSPVKVTRVRAAFAFALASIAGGNCKQVLADRTPASALDTSLGLLGRALIGVKLHERVRLNELKAKIVAMNPLALADFEIENKVTRLIADADLALDLVTGGAEGSADVGSTLDVAGATDADFYVSHHGSSTVIPAEAAPVVAEIQRQLERYPGASLPTSTPGFFDMNLYMVFYEDASAKRIYLSGKDKDLANSTIKLIKASFDDHDYDDQDLRENGGTLTLRDVTCRNVRLQMGKDFVEPLFDALFSELEPQLEALSRRGAPARKSQVAKEPAPVTAVAAPAAAPTAAPTTAQPTAARQHNATDTHVKKRQPDAAAAASGGPISAMTKAVSRYVDPSSAEYTEYRRDGAPVPLVPVRREPKEPKPKRDPKETKKVAPIHEDTTAMRAPRDPAKWAFIGNLPSDVTERDIRDAFDGLAIRAVELRVQRTVGFAFVEFATRVGRDDAILMRDGSLIGGRKVRVAELNEKQSSRAADSPPPPAASSAADHPPPAHRGATDRPQPAATSDPKKVAEEAKRRRARRGGGGGGGAVKPDAADGV